MLQVPPRPRSTLFSVLLLWLAFYASFTLFAPPLLDDADSVHAEVAREMLLRHDYVTLYANGIRYLEKAPLLYWSMAASMKVFGVSAAAARLPLALAVLGLALLLEAFARRLFHSARAGLYAGLILLSGFGIFIFTRITIPDAGVCLWISLALYCFWRTEELDASRGFSQVSNQSRVSSFEFRDVAAGSSQLEDAETRRSTATAPNFSPRPHLRLYCGGFAAACALNVLTKGLIGVVFPVGVVLGYLLLTRGVRRTLRRLRELHPWASLEAFLLIAAPWHILAGIANPTEGHPTAFHFVNGHWQVPLPSDGNVRGWFWFYFMNEHVLRYLNLRVPHDYDTAPLWLFWGLCFVWMMPWSAFVFKAAGWALPCRNDKWRSQLRRHDLPLRPRGLLLCVVWAAFVLLFFSLSTRQEYYVLPALPAVALLIAGWLAYQAPTKPEGQAQRRSTNRCLTALLVLGAIFSSASVYFLLHAKAPAPNTDLAQLLQQNPGDYALSMGHFLDLNAQALGLFRLPLGLAALSLFLGPLASLILRKKAKPHSANLALAAGAFGFLLAAHLGLQTFAPVIGSAELAKAIAPQVQPQDMIAIHGEYESGSTLGFYLKRDDIHILEGRSSNLWYGSFFPDAPPIFETPQSIAEKWVGPQRIFLWQSLTDEPRNLPALPGPVYILVKNGGKEIVSNRPNR